MKNCYIVQDSYWDHESPNVHCLLLVDATISLDVERQLFERIYQEHRYNTLAKDYKDTADDLFALGYNRDGKLPFEQVTERLVRIEQIRANYGIAAGNDHRCETNLAFAQFLQYKYPQLVYKQEYKYL